MSSNFIPNNIPGILITQQLDGVPAGEIIETQKNKLDEGNSNIYGTSFFVEYDKGKNITQPKNTADKIVIGYTSGLPFQIVVNGSSDSERETIFRFINQYVTPLMNDYAKKLSISYNAEETIKTLIRTIFKNAPNAEFTMSIGITYEKDNCLYCAGFGIGDTGLALRKSDGKIQQLADKTVVNHSKDAFGQHSLTTDIENIINRNSLFNVPVKAGDEIFGYTDLLLILAKKKEFLNPYSLEPIVKYQLEIASIETSLYKSVRKENDKSFEFICNAAQRNKSSMKVGDDCTIGSVFIPTQDLQNSLKRNIQTKDKWHERLVSEKNWLKRAFWNIAYFLSRVFSLGAWDPLNKNNLITMKILKPTPAIAPSGTNQIAQSLGGLHRDISATSIQNTASLSEAEVKNDGTQPSQHLLESTTENTPETHQPIIYQ